MAAGEQKRQHSQIYILRIWAEPVSGQEPLQWRYLLQNPFSKARRGFASLEELTNFLANQTPSSSNRRP